MVLITEQLLRPSTRSGKSLHVYIRNSSIIKTLFPISWFKAIRHRQDPPQFQSSFVDTNHLVGHQIRAHQIPLRALYTNRAPPPLSMCLLAKYQGPDQVQIWQISAIRIESYIRIMSNILKLKLLSPVLLGCTHFVHNCSSVPHSAGIGPSDFRLLTNSLWYNWSQAVWWFRRNTLSVQQKIKLDKSNATEP